MTGRAPLDVWSRSVRRAIRDWTGENMVVPPLLGAVSVGGNPRRVEAHFRLDLLPDRDSVEAQLRRMVVDHESRFAAYGGVVGSSFDRRLVLVACSGRSFDGWRCPIDTDGLGGWERASVVEIAGPIPLGLQNALLEADRG